MIVCGNQDVERIRRRDGHINFHSHGKRRLQKGRLASVRHAETPGLVPRKLWQCQPPKQIAPIHLTLRCMNQARMMECQRGQLYEKHVPKRPLVWAKCRIDRSEEHTS